MSKLTDQIITVEIPKEYEYLFECIVFMIEMEIIDKKLLTKILKDYLAKEGLSNLFAVEGGEPVTGEDEDDIWDDTTTVSHVDPNPSLTPDQREGLVELLLFVKSDDLLHRLVGFAGTGKSFLICEFIRSLQLRYLAACPTNKAAKNLTNIAKEAKLDLEVKTVAQILGQQPELNKDTGKEEFISNGSDVFSDYDLVIIDESSMVNKANFKEILDQSKLYKTQVLFVGDSAQLAPVKEKKSMAAIYNMGETRLEKVVRYDGEIARVAEAIRSFPKIPEFNTSEDQTIVCLGNEAWMEKALSFFTSAAYQADADLVRFLAWRNLTVESLNQAVRDRLWGKDAPPYLPGDRLIARKPLFRPKSGGKGKNKWRIFINNSEEATVTKPGILTTKTINRIQYSCWEVMVQPEGGGREQQLVILHEDSKALHKTNIAEYLKRGQWSSYFDLSRIFDDVGWAYALTVHKSQGSTINNVFIDLPDIKRSRDKQKLLYTALTRTKGRAFILK